MAQGSSSEGSSGQVPRLIHLAAIACSFGGLLGEGPVFLLFAVIGVLAFIFVQRRVPETQGKSLEQIEAELRGGRSKPT